MSRERPSNWNTVRKKVYKNDNYTCQNCGRKGGPRGEAELHAHHVVELSKGGTNKPSNLTTLCKGCHGSIHTSAMAPSAVKNNTHDAELGPVGEAIAVLIGMGIMAVLIGLIPATVGFYIHPILGYVIWIVSSVGLFIYTISDRPWESYTHELTDFGLLSENPTIVEDLAGEDFPDQPVCENDEVVVFHVAPKEYRKFVGKISGKTDSGVSDFELQMVKTEKRHAPSAAKTRSPIKKPLVIDARTFADD